MKLTNWLLRSLILLGLAILFFPSIDIPFTGKAPSVTVLIDNSTSMSEQSKQNQWKELAALLEKLSGSVSLKVYAFSDSISSVKDIGKIEFEGNSTDIFYAVEQATKSNEEAILLVSDGRHNQSGTSFPVITRPLWSVILGSGNAADIGIEDVSVADSNILKVRLRSTSTDNVSSTLRLYAKNKELLSQSVILPSNRLTEILVPVPKGAMDNPLRISVDSLASEDRTDNNIYVFHPSKTARTLNILFIASLINQDTEALLEILKTIPRTTLSTWLEISPGQILDKQLSDPDIVVVGPLNENTSPSILGKIKSLSSSKPTLFVSSSGNLPSEIKDLSPLRADAPAVVDDGIRTAPVGDILLSKTPITSMMNLQYSQRFGANNDATELVGINNSSVIAIKPAPNRIMAIELPTSWITSSRNRESAVSLLRSSFSYLSDPKGFPFSFSVNKSTTAGIDLTLFSEVTIDDELPAAWLMPDSIPLRTIPSTANSCKLTGTAPAGEYRARISWKDATSTPRGSFEVIQTPPEKESKGSNPTLITQLVGQTGGEILKINEVEAFFKSLPRKKATFKPLQNPLIVIIIGSLFLVEIWHRRKAGLP